MPRVPRIPAPIIDRIPPPIVSTPIFAPPVVDALRPPVVDIPSFEPPSYEPPTLNGRPVVPIPRPGGSEDQEEENEEENRELPNPEIPVLPDPTAGRNTIDVPYVGTVPLPTTSEVGLAGTTAVAATAAALIGKSLVEVLVARLKPIVKKIMLKLKERSGKQFTDYELQLYFELTEQVPEQKSVAKQLKAGLKDSKKSQLEAHLQRQRQNKR